MSALAGSHYCLAHQGNHSHYAEENCEVCKLERQVAALKVELNHRSAELTGAFHQLAASQAREQKLRDALQFYMTPPIGQLNDHHIAAAKLGVAVLALPTDDTALQARLKEEREKVIALYSPDDTAQDWIDKIRSMT